MTLTRFDGRKMRAVPMRAAATRCGGSPKGHRATGPGNKGTSTLAAAREAYVLRLAKGRYAFLAAPFADALFFSGHVCGAAPLTSLFRASADVRRVAPSRYRDPRTCPEFVHWQRGVSQ